MSNLLTPDAAVSDDTAMAEWLYDMLQNDPHHFQTHVNDALADGRLRIRNPEENALTVITNHFHRSHINDLQRKVYRRFLAVTTDFY